MFCASIHPLPTIYQSLSCGGSLQSKPRCPSPWPHLPEKYQYVPGPDGIYNPSSIFWVFPMASSRRHPDWMSEPSQLAPFNMKKQWCFSELPPNGRTPHPIPKGESRHLAEETHFCDIPNLISLVTNQSSWPWVTVVFKKKNSILYTIIDLIVFQLALNNY